MIGKDRRLAFEAMVLQALWLIIWMVAKQYKMPWIGNDLRLNMVMYLDANGVQGDKAQELRREKFPEVRI